MNHRRSSPRGTVGDREGGGLVEEERGEKRKSAEPQSRPVATKRRYSGGMVKCVARRREGVARQSCAAHQRPTTAERDKQ